MSEYPVFNLVAVPHSEVASASRVFSLEEVEYFLYVKVPVEFAKNFELYQVDEITDRAEYVKCYKLWDHDPGRIWYRFHSCKLNLNPGYHTYRLSFVNRINNVTSLLYIAYVIQSNNPSKPYMYMDKANRSCECDENN